MFNSMYSIKLIEAGQTRAIKTVRAGAGLSGNAVVLQAPKGGRFQLADVVSQASPERLGMKRVGDSLHIALPGGDADNPDIILQNFYAADGAQLQGATVRGEWQSYATQSLDSANISRGVEGTSAGTLAVRDAAAQSVGFEAEGVTGWLHNTNPWLLGGGGLALAAVAGGGGGGSKTTTGDNTAAALDAMKAFTADSAAIGSKTAATPTLQNYTDLGIKAFASLTDTSEGSRVALTGTHLSALNSALDKLDAASLTKDKVQAMADAYYRILAEADGDPNVNKDVYADTTNDADNAATYNDPTAADYAAVGAKIGSTTRALNLLNDVVGRLATTAVDAVDEIDALAKAAENVMLLAAQDTSASNDPSATASGPAVFASDAEWVNGLSRLGITGLSSTLIADIKAAIKLAANDGTTVDTVKELQDLINPIVGLRILKDFTADSAAIGSKTAATPTLQNYTDLGIKAFASLTDTSEGSRVALTGTHLSALNSALDKLDAASLTKDKVQAMADAYYRILAEADGDPNVNKDVYADTTNDADNAATYNDPTAADYAAVGAKIGSTAQALNLLNDAVGRQATTAVDTVDEIDALAQAAENVMLLAAQDAGTSAAPSATSNGPAAYTSDAEWVNGLGRLGITGLKSTLIADIKAAIQSAANDGTTVDTVKELQDLINPIVSLQVLKDFTADSAAIGSKTATTPTLSNWASALQSPASGGGVNTSLSDETRIKLDEATYWKTTNPANALAALNSALDTYATIDTATLQAIVDSYGRILQEADGNRFVNTDISAISKTADRDGADLVAQDLVNVGAKLANTAGITDAASQKALLLSVIGNLKSTSVDTVEEINALAIVADNIMRQAKGLSVTYTDTDWGNALNSLGITGITSSNISNIKAALNDAVTNNAATEKTAFEAIDSYAELQALVSLTRVKDYAALSTNASPTIEDYQFLARGSNEDYNIAKNANLSAYNDIANSWSASSNITEAGIKAMVESYNTVLDLADGNRASSTPTLNKSVYGALDIDTMPGQDRTTDGEANATKLLTNIIDGLGRDKVDTLNELLSLSQTSKTIMDLAGTAAGMTPSSTTLQGTLSTVTLTRKELAEIGLTDGAGHAINEASGTTYWVTEAELTYFRNSVAIHSNAEVSTLSNLQTLMQQAIVVA